MKPLGPAVKTPDFDSGNGGSNPPVAAKPSPDQMRGMGYAAYAEVAYLSDAAWACFCAWVNIAPEKMPPHGRWKPAETAKAWERVASANGQLGKQE